MVLTRVGAFSAPPIFASLNPRQPEPKVLNKTGLKNNAYNNILPKSHIINQAANQIQTARFKPMASDFMALKSTAKKQPTQKANPKKSGPESADTRKAAVRENALKSLEVVDVQVPEGPVCNPGSSIDQEPHPDCGLTSDDAKRLADAAVEGKNFPGRKLLMKKIKTPWDILTSDRAISKALDKANKGATPEQIKANNMRALFLRDNVGQCVINQAMRTWHGKRVMAAYVLKVLPSEMNPRIPAVQSLEGDGQLGREEARLLADSFILQQPLADLHEKLEQVIGFKDLVVLEEEAIQSLEAAREQAKTPQAKARQAMNFLFLLHDVGTQTAQRVMTERADRVAYMKHMVKSLFVS